MAIFHDVIKSMGTAYDPLAGNVVAHIVGGGHVGNTVFRDLSPLQTPAVTKGAVKGALVTGPFGSDVGLAGNTGAITLVAPDNRFGMTGSNLGTQGASGGFTVDGWFRANSPVLTAYDDHSRPVFCLHGNGFDGGSGYFYWRRNGSQSGLVLGLLYARYGPDSTVVGLCTGAHELSPSYGYTPILNPAHTPLPTALRNQWLYYHLRVTKIADDQAAFVLRLHNLAPISYTDTFYWSDYPNLSISVGGAPNGSNPITNHYAFRLTKGNRPYNAAMLTSPWPVRGGTTNWLGAPAGQSAAAGQKVLLPGEVWVAPPGVDKFSAVAVGCKLTIQGTEVLRATWPVLGDGGGQGGAGGSGHSTSVTSPGASSGPAFGGSPPPPPVTTTYHYPGGGGGAGGYTGKGGDGVSSRGSTASSGGGGGGGGGSPGYDGGGVGLKGTGPSGTGGGRPGHPGSANGPVYGGGKGGTTGDYGTLNGRPGNHLAWRNDIPVNPGQVVLCNYIGETGQTGAARIIWGDDRSFPDNAGDIE